MNSIRNGFRDGLLLMLLICMVRVAADGSYVEKGEYSAHNATQNAKTLKAPFTVHQADPEFLCYLDETEQQINNLMMLPNLNPECIEQLQEIKNKVEIIRQDCQKNSLAMAILGPIGTTAIVMKEQRLTNQLKEIIVNLRTILKTFLDPNVFPQLHEERIASIEDNLQLNKEYFNQVVS